MIVSNFSLRFQNCHFIEYFVTLGKCFVSLRINYYQYFEKIPFVIFQRSTLQSQIVAKNRELIIDSVVTFASVLVIAVFLIAGLNFKTIRNPDVPLKAGLVFLVNSFLTAAPLYKEILYWLSSDAQQTFYTIPQPPLRNVLEMSNTNVLFCYTFPFFPDI